jgi:hypothetical protein
MTKSGIHSFTPAELLLATMTILLVMGAVVGLGAKWAYDTGFYGIGKRDKVTISMWRTDVIDLCGVPDASRTTQMAGLDGSAIDIVTDTYDADRQKDGNGCAGHLTYTRYKLTRISR